MMNNVFGVRSTKSFDLAAYLAQDRDLIMVHPGDSMPAKAVNALLRVGWLGGNFCRWVDGGDGQPTIDIADGRYCGFFRYGSNEQYEKYSVTQYSNLEYGYAVFGFGGNFVYTRIYERYGYLARHVLGPMAPLVYTANQYLYVSENGKITPEDESDFGIFPPHTFPNGDPITSRFVFFGVCAVPPSTITNQYLATQTNFGI